MCVSLREGMKVSLMPSSTELKSLSDQEYLDQSVFDQHLIPKAQESHTQSLGLKSVSACFPNSKLSPHASLFRIL